MQLPLVRPPARGGRRVNDGCDFRDLVGGKARDFYVFADEAFVVCEINGLSPISEQCLSGGF